MARSIPLRVAWRPRLSLPLEHLDWFALYLATAGLLFFVVAPFVALPSRWFLGMDKGVVLNNTLVLLLSFEALLLGWLWLELPRRRRAEASLKKIRSIQQAISRASERIESLNPLDLDEAFHRELAVLQDLLQVDQITWFEKSADGTGYLPLGTSGNRRTGLWNQVSGSNNFAWMTRVISAGEPVRVRHLDELPPEAAVESRRLKQMGVISFAVIPSSCGPGATGAIVLTSLWREIVWDEQLIGQVAVLASMFATAHTRKMALDAVRASEFRFRQLFDDSPIGIALLNSQGQIKIANGTLAKLLARTVEELGQKTIMDLTFPDDMARTWLHLQELLAGVRDICHIEERLRRQDGSARSIRITMSIVGARNGDERMVLAMVEDRTEALRVREQLDESRLMLTLALEASRTTAWEYDPPTDEFVWLDRSKLRAPEWQAPASDSFTNVLSHVVPEDWARLRGLAEQILKSGGAFSTEFRMIGKDGSVRWMLGKGELSQKSTSASPKIVGVTVDVSGLKRAHLELQELAKSLMDAQEAERKKISRELHDDIGQRVALLAMELDIVGQNLPLDHELRARVDRIQSAAEELSSDLHQLSHQLHSSKLQYLGLQAALRELCKRIGEKHELIVELDCADKKPYLREEEALALYRVAQEALNNVIRHSHATKARVVLSITDTHADLAVIDDGKGFEPTSPSCGIGLIGMRERIRAVGGEFRIVSLKDRGTEIHAGVRLTGRTIRELSQAATGS
jgi:PAS domain S-box-containing protein